MQSSLRLGKLRHFAPRSLSKGHVMHVLDIEYSEPSMFLCVRYVSFVV